LVERLVAHQVPARVVVSLDGAEIILRAAAKPGVVLVTFGARDPGLPRLARSLTGPPQPKPVWETMLDDPEAE